MGNLHLYIVTVFSCLFLLSCSSDSSTTYYSLTVTPTPAEGGTVSPSGGEFEAGQEVELSVQANENWRFDSWHGDHSGSRPRSEERRVGKEWRTERRKAAGKQKSSK